MIMIRWKHYLWTLLLMVSSPLMASMIYSSPSLNEANSLVNIVPKQAKQSTNYLNQRILSDKTEQSPSGISRETDGRTRTRGAL